MNEPKTPKEWHAWIFSQNHFGTAIVEAIRLAQAQSRREAIEECASFMENEQLGMIYPSEALKRSLKSIRALLQLKEGEK